MKGNYYQLKSIRSLFENVLKESYFLFKVDWEVPKFT